VTGYAVGTTTGSIGIGSALSGVGGTTISTGCIIIGYGTGTGTGAGLAGTYILSANQTGPSTGDILAQNGPAAKDVKVEIANASQGWQMGGTGIITATTSEIQSKCLAEITNAGVATSQLGMNIVAYGTSTSGLFNATVDTRIDFTVRITSRAWGISNDTTDVLSLVGFRLELHP
jgi:hypothetical protein